jgi:hypothetical protein
MGHTGSCLTVNGGRGEEMIVLHPDLGSSRDPLSTWQVDTEEIDKVVKLYSVSCGSTP